MSVVVHPQQQQRLTVCCSSDSWVGLAGALQGRIKPCPSWPSDELAAAAAQPLPFPPPLPLLLLSAWCCCCCCRHCWPAAAAATAAAAAAAAAVARLLSAPCCCCGSFSCMRLLPLLRCSRACRTDTTANAELLAAAATQLLPFPPPPSPLLPLLVLLSASRRSGSCGFEVLPLLRCIRACRKETTVTPSAAVAAAPTHTFWAQLATSGVLHRSRWCLLGAAARSAGGAGAIACRLLCTAILQDRVVGRCGCEKLLHKRYNVAWDSETARRARYFRFRDGQHGSTWRAQLVHFKAVVSMHTGTAFVQLPICCGRPGRAKTCSVGQTCLACSPPWPHKHCIRPCSLSLSH